jgi:hypothetical protein
MCPNPLIRLLEPAQILSNLVIVTPKSLGPTFTGPCTPPNDFRSTARHRSPDRLHGLAYPVRGQAKTRCPDIRGPTAVRIPMFVFRATKPPESRGSSPRTRINYAYYASTGGRTVIQLPHVRPRVTERRLPTQPADPSGSTRILPAHRLNKTRNFVRVETKTGREGDQLSGLESRVNLVNCSSRLIF